MTQTGIILAGGRSSRFGSNKAIFDFQGKTMLKHSVDLLKSFCEYILISGNKEEYYKYDYPSIPDKYGEIGPIGGILSCLEESKTELNIIVTCDMPLVTEDLLSKLLSRHKPGCVTAFLDNSGRIYPFPFIIERCQLHVVKRHIINQQYKLKNMFDEIGFCPVSVSEEESKLLANINSKDDLLVIEDILNNK